MNGYGTTDAMLDVPIDAWYVWLGLAAASTGLLGIASAVPSAPPPDGAGAAETVDAVAASEYADVGVHPLSHADQVRVGAHGLSLRGEGGTAHAELRYGPVTPARTARLERVLYGGSPQEAFGSPAAFAAATESVDALEPAWRRTDTLRVRRITWEGIDVTLVG